MNPDTSPLTEKNWTATKLRKLPADQGEAILAAAAALAEEIYRNDPLLTDFEAFGEEDLYAPRHLPGGYTPRISARR